MINLKQELENYPIIDLKNVMEISPDISDNVKNSIILYNKALESLKIDSEDMAIIELKKSISMNPNFHEAMNLLGLCYSYTKEHSKAMEIFERVVAAENNSVQALRYMSMLNGGGSQASAIDGKLRGSRRKIPEKSIEKKGESGVNVLSSIWINDKKDILKYALGFAAGTVIMLTVALSWGAFSQESKPASNEAAEPGGMVQDIDYKAKYEELEQNFTALQGRVSEADSQVEYYNNVIKLFEVESLAAQQKPEAAADLLMLLKAVSFKDAEKAKFDEIYNEVMPKACTALLNNGMSLMNSKKYQEAVEKLNKIPVYMSEWRNMDRTLYNVGKCYVYMNDSRNALSAFQQLKDEYPKSQYAAYANSRIKSLTQNP